jgi:hypothetical protein
VFVGGGVGLAGAVGAAAGYSVKVFLDEILAKLRAALVDGDGMADDKRGTYAVLEVGVRSAQLGCGGVYFSRCTETWRISLARHFRTWGLN